MSFEFFFGLFGLISSDSRSRHESRLETDWRLFTPLGASLLRDPSSTISSIKDPGSALYSSSQSSATKPASSFNLSGGIKVGQKTPVPNATHTFGNISNSGSEGVLASPSPSSSASIASSGSGSTIDSTATLVKPLSGEERLSNENSRYQHLTNNTDYLGKSSTKRDSADTSVADESILTFSKRVRGIYCRWVCFLLWVHVGRLLAGLVIEKSLFTLDFYHLGAFRIHFLIPALCLAIQVAAVSLIFIRNNDETNWLVPFYSSKDYLIRSRSNFRPKIEDYKRRVNISVTLALIMAMISSISLSAYLINSALQSEVMQTVDGSTQDSNGPAEWNWEKIVLIGLLSMDVLWAIYSTYICFLVSFYFNLICSIMKFRFHSISKVIEDLAESDTSKTTNQARKITTLYLEHNEACELLDESNDFWQYLIFFTYFTYIPAYCYCLYNLFFVDFEAWPSFMTWVIHTHTGLIILLISFSAAGVSTEIATFLHRVRGLTIGYSCYDLFAITNASMSNTAAACASYFLIVADFSRSSVFTLAQMNGSTSAMSGKAVVTPSSLVSGTMSSLMASSSRVPN